MPLDITNQDTADTPGVVPSALPKPGKASPFSGIFAQSDAKKAENAATLESDKRDLGQRAIQFHSDLDAYNAQSRTPPTPKQPNPVEQWGSPAMWLAGIASAFSRHSLTNALNAGAQVMNAYRANDQAAAQQAFQTWKQQTEIAGKQLQFEQDAYKAAIDKYKVDQTAGRAEMLATASALKDTAVRSLLEQGRTDEAMNVLVGRNVMGKKMGDAAGKLSELNYARGAEAAYRAAQAKGDTAAMARIKADFQLHQEFTAAGARADMAESRKEDLDPRIKVRRDLAEALRDKQIAAATGDETMKADAEARIAAGHEALDALNDKATAGDKAAGRTPTTPQGIAVAKFMSENPDASADDIQKFIIGFKADPAKDRRLDQGDRRLDQGDTRLAQGDRRLDQGDTRMSEIARHDAALEKLRTQQFGSEDERRRAQTAETARHDAAMEALGGRRADQGDARLDQGNLRLAQEGVRLSQGDRRLDQQADKPRPPTAQRADMAKADAEDEIKRQNAARTAAGKPPLSEAEARAVREGKLDELKSGAITPVQRAGYQHVVNEATDGMDHADRALHIIQNTVGAAGGLSRLGRAAETLGNILGASGTERAQFRNEISMLKQADAASANSTGARPLAAQMKIIDDILTTDKWGVSSRAVFSALQQVQNELYRRRQIAEATLTPGGWSPDLPIRELAPLSFGASPASGGASSSSFDQFPVAP